MTDFNEPQEQNVGERSSGLLSANEPAWSWFPLAIQSSEFRNSTGVWLFKCDIYAAPSQGSHAIGPGIAPQGDVSTRSSAGEADISQQHTLPSFDAFFAHWADPSRNSAETTDTSLDCRYSPDLLLHIDLLASSLRFWSPFPSSSAPGGCQRWLKGLQGAFQSFIQVLVFKDLGQSSSCTHTRTHTPTHKLHW